MAKDSITYQSLITESLTKGSAITTSLVKSSLIGTEVIAPILQCDTPGFAFADQADAYGLVFDGIINKGVLSSRIQELYFIASDTTSRSSTNTGYLFIFNSDDSIQLYRMNGGGVTFLSNTGAAYMENDKDYRVFVWRNETVNEFVTGAIGTIATYIQGKSKPITSKNYEIPDTNDMELIDVLGGSGSNPITDNTYTGSNFIVLDFDAGNQISKIRVNNQLIAPSDFTISSGSYSIITG